MAPVGSPSPPSSPPCSGYGDAVESVDDMTSDPQDARTLKAEMSLFGIVALLDNWVVNEIASVRVPNGKPHVLSEQIREWRDFLADYLRTFGTGEAVDALLSSVDLDLRTSTDQQDTLSGADTVQGQGLARTFALSDDFKSVFLESGELAHLVYCHYCGDQHYCVSIGKETLEGDTGDDRTVEES
jgi:hypothetical protein